MEVKTFGVIGAGQMGNGIAQVAAASGLAVIMNDISEEFVDKGLKTIAGILARNVEKGKMTAADKDALLGRIQASVSLKDMAAADFVVEAATEKQEHQVPDLPRARPALQTGSDPGHQHLLHPHRPHRRPDQAAGQGHRHALHEPGAGDEAGRDHPRAWRPRRRRFKITWDLALKFGKTPAEANDYPGFIANRILHADDQRGRLLPLPRGRDARRTSTRS